ncbi:MAG: 4Fe-4S binding protein [Promethearchaeota archaeon]
MTAQIFQDQCIGCGWCIDVCPHQIIIFDENKKATIIEGDKCIECGACELQCPSNAILTHPLGCGCISGVLKTKIRKLLRQELKQVCC